MRGWATAVATRSPPVGSVRRGVDLVDLGEPAAQRAAAGAPAGALAGEQEADRGPGRRRGRRRRRPSAANELRLAGVERGHAAAAARCSASSGERGHDRRPVRPVAPGRRCSVGGQVAQLGVGQLRHEVDQLAPAARAARPGVARRTAAARRPARRRPAPWCGVERGRVGAAAGALQHDVGVDAAEAHRGDAGPDRLVGRPRLGRRAAPAAPASGRRAARCGSTQPVVGGMHLVVHGQDGLDQPGHAGRGLGVADLRLDRADRRGAARPGRRAARACGERLQLGRVADRGAGAVALEVGRRCRCRSRPARTRGCSASW